MHPVKSKLSQETKDMILKRIKAADQTEAAKEEEVGKVKAYWSRLAL